MCIAVVTRKGASLSVEQLRSGWAINNDGGGFAYVKDGKVEIEKGFMKLPDMEKAYFAAVEKYAETSPFLVHMRIRTSGETDPHNTHPFKIKGGAMIHNGILFSPTGELAGKEGRRNSDTRILATVGHNILTKDHVTIAKSMLEDIFGYNKLCFLYDDGDYVILNEDLGDWEKGIWFSNGSCKTSYWGRYSKHSGSS